MPEQPVENMPEQAGQENEQQDSYNIFVAQGIRLVKEIAPKLRGAASIDTLGNTLFDIVAKVETDAEKQGIKFDLPVLLHGSNEILGHLIQFSDVDIQEDQIKAVVAIAVGRYLDNALKSGKMTMDELQQLAQAAQQTAGGMQNG